MKAKTNMSDHIDAVQRTDQSKNVMPVTPESSSSIQVMDTVGLPGKIKPRRFNKLGLILVVLIFGGLGPYLLLTSYASTSAAEEIVSQASGRCLDVYKALAANNSITDIYDCHNTASQQWKVDSDGAIRSIASGRCLSLKDGLTANSTPVVIYDCKGTSSQKWTIYSNGTVHSTTNGRCLDLKGGATVNTTPVIIYNCNHTSTQKWKIAAPSLSGNKITFTYKSPNNPWTSTELSRLQTWQATYYPLIVNIYGYPKVSYTVNVIKNPNIQGETGIKGTYSYSSGSGSISGYLTLGDLSEQVFVHEMIHAFRADAVLSNSAWEEGMTRAAEVEAFDRTQGSNFDINHKYTDDVYYEAEDSTNVGAQSGDFWSHGMPAMALLRYQLAGYAWGKMEIEDPTFLSRFNAALYANPTIQSSTTQLTNLVGSLKTTVEGVSTSTWLKGQNILNATPAAGCFLYQRVADLTVAAYCRDTNGYETPQTGVTITLTSYDYTGNILTKAQLPTSSFGTAAFASAYNMWPETYSGMVKLVATATINGQLLTDTHYAVANTDQTGLFGVITDAAKGNLTFNSPNNTFQPITVSATNGVFSVPQLAAARGQIKVNYTSTTGAIGSRIITKDASGYFLSITL